MQLRSSQALRTIEPHFLSMQDVERETATNEEPVQDQTWYQSKRTDTGTLKIEFVSRYPLVMLVRRCAELITYSQGFVPATHAVQAKPRSNQEKLLQELFADWVIEPLYPMNLAKFYRSWRIPFVFRESFESPVGVSMWELYYRRDAVMDGELPGEGLNGYGMGFVCVHIPVSSSESRFDVYSVCQSKANSTGAPVDGRREPGVLPLL